jgi:phosphatidylserine/phosphatidylglycerophosphate/cardiolipin synthase-like enzyme
MFMKKIIGVAIFGVAMLIVGCGAGSVMSLKNGNQALASVSTASGTTAHVDFAFTRAGQNPEGKLISVINSAHHSLDIAIYSLTDPKIVQAILDAKHRGVIVRVITDKQEASSSYQSAALRELLDAGIPIKENTHQGLMHLKVSIVDNQEVTTGSYNYTKSASEYNDEVFVVILNPNIAKTWDSEFNQMWNDTQNYTDVTPSMLTSHTGSNTYSDGSSNSYRYNHHSSHSYHSHTSYGSSNGFGY